MKITKIISIIAVVFSFYDFFRGVQAPLLNGTILDEGLESIKEAFRIAAKSTQTTD
ncbi:hypothetical protein [Olivibacter domesticus]|uniref:hypothetical protein n=1 Tax=Olivibacter domesticus TaxID=407022 RepID=UPI00138FF0F1|nr:hypothetical protein [Olivibacter domesticus]